MAYTCPVCNYDGLEEPPYDDSGWGSFEICPQCGTEFGYDSLVSYFRKASFGNVCNFVWHTVELDALHTELREKWIAGGSKWWSKRRTAP